MVFETDSSSPFAVGADLKTESDGIIALLKRLRDATDGEEYDHLFKPAEDILTNAITSISFIGQVKAGKTSLVNALITKPNFLPSDVNPWTAVVTRLFFNKPGGPHKGAHFSFFDDQQWDKFANRGGRLGELAEEIPDSEEKLNDIRLEVEQMRERAKIQLGDKFQSLLGKTHRFDNASTDVLARYICAGDDPDALVKKNVQGRYADITREASVFFEKEKFASPVVMVDTPGLNDPLMILADEPVASLDPATSRTILEHLRNICHDDGITIVCNLHDLSFAKEFSDRIVGLADGKLIYDGSPEGVDANTYEIVYGVKPVVI